ncbi:hypothetical protein [Phytoactinopolyspora endophytica]|uniref:hypothetical protein n=1 Tax=Phytoactinopolyspora endophytica TaxID=1642495 RepID=UPI00101D8126|nr:hypothetical protein [Phytoactinopolyspora endophytica]
MGRKARRWGIGLLSVGAAAVLTTVVVVNHVNAEKESVDGARNLGDVDFLDDYAAELGLVMVRNREPDPEAYARLADGPGRDVEALELSGPPGEESPGVVLRLRRERQESTGWMSGIGEIYEISACYRWEFGDMDDHEPQRLDECPSTPVIEIGPAPVVPTLPAGIDDVLRDSLEPLAAGGNVSEDAVADAVRSAYTEAVENALDGPDVDPKEILSSDDIVTGDDWVVTVDDAVGVAIGRDRSCVMAQVVPDEVTVWRPRRISLEPGEVGCSASSAAGGGHHW